MEIVCFASGVNGLHPRQGLQDLKQAGFDKLVLDFGWLSNVHESTLTIGRIAKKPPRSWLSLHPEAVAKVTAPYVEKFVAAGFSLPLAWAPYIGWLKDEVEAKVDLTDILTDFVTACLPVAGKAGCRYMAVSPLAPELIGSRELWEANRAYYLRLGAAARPYGVQLLLKGRCRNQNGRAVRGVGTDENMTAQWIDALNKEVGAEVFGYCLDVGIASVCGQNMYDLAVTMGHRLKAVILREASNVWGGSLLPFSLARGGESQTDWLNLIRGLRRIDFDGQLIMNCGDTLAAFSPLLRPDVLCLAKKTADYIAWQVKMEQLLAKYDTRVLFGAGNMCRNYLKCYGEQYPPLFTCDNDPAKWGTKFCGLEVRAPECLLDLPEDCAVFICNTYYRDIEEQLREMGLKNPVEFFNDEFMPSFYFERLEELAEGGAETC